VDHRPEGSARTGQREERGQVAAAVVGRGGDRDRIDVARLQGVDELVAGAGGAHRDDDGPAVELLPWHSQSVMMGAIDRPSQRAGDLGMPE
jgi:hypothetical protein